MTTTTTTTTTATSTTTANKVCRHQNVLEPTWIISQWVWCTNYFLRCEREWRKIEEFQII